MVEPDAQSRGKTPAPAPAVSRLPILSRPGIICLLLTIATIAVFGQVIRFEFINYDDPVYFKANHHVLRGLSWSNVAWAFETTLHASWYPFTWLSYLWDATAFGSGPTGPHLTNLLLHVANSLLVFLMLQRLTGTIWRSALVAALFALHPLHVEPVAWISERKGLLSAFFGLLTIWAYVKYTEARRASARTTDAPGRIPVASYYALALVLFACGLLSKPSLVALPVALLLLDYWPLHRLDTSSTRSELRSISTLLLEKIPFLLLGVLSSIITIWVHKQAGALASLATVSMAHRIESAFVSYARYLAKALWPWPLALPYPDPGSWPLSVVLVGVALVAGASLLALYWRRKRPYFLVGWFWFLFLLSPVIGIIGWGAHTIADRFMYLPILGLFIIAAWGGAELLEARSWPKWLAAVGAAAMLAACTIRTNDQLGYWRNSETLFRHSLAVTTNNIVALDHLGIRLSFEGQSEEAIACFLEALRLNPNSPQVRYDLGNALAAQGRFAEAITNYQRAIEALPGHYEAHDRLGLVSAMQGSFDEAISHHRRALEYSPNEPSVHKHLANALGAAGQMDEAIKHYRLALRESPDDAEIQYSLGLALAVRGNWEEALGHYNATTRLDPANAEAHYNLGYALRVVGRLEESATCLSNAVQLKSEFPLAHYNLGCVLAEKGRLEAAEFHFQEAVRLSPDYDEARKKLDELVMRRANQTNQ